jgi:ACS family tartrate transporter-like MFS transporter
MSPADETGATATARVRRRLIPFLFLLYVVAYLDRVNVGFAALDMNRDLGFSAAVYGLGSGVFFLSYFLLEVPSNLALARLGARVWIARIMASWGVLSAAMVFVHDATSFYVLRFLLGAAEAGFFPGVIYYLTRWFPVRERAHAVALFLTATAIAGVIGAPLSSALLLLDGTGGLRGWQWLFLIEGLPAVLLAPVVLVYLTERPEDATWLTPVERRWLATELARDAASAPAAHASFGAAVADPRLWRLALVYGCLVVAFYGVGFWLPQIVQGLSGYSSSVVALVSALPYAVAAVGMVLAGASSDRTGERRWHVAGPALLGATGFLLTAFGPGGVAWSMATLSLAALGVYSALGPFWALPAALLRGPAAAGGIAVINSVGNLGGFVGPSLVGLVRDRTGSFAGGLALLAAGLVAGALLTLTLPRARGR